MRIPILVVCLLVLTAGCIGNTEVPVQPGETERTSTESTTSPQQPKTSSSPKYDANADRVEVLIHEKMNKHRRKNGLEPLSRNKTLDAAARYKSWDMAQRDYFAHTGPNGTTVGVKYIKEKMQCEAIGENLQKAGYGDSVAYDGDELPDSNQIATDAVTALLNSPGHRENALSPNYDSQGIGVFVDENGTVFVTQELCG